MVCYVLSLSVYQGSTEVSLGPLSCLLSLFTLSILSMRLQPMLQSTLSWASLCCHSLFVLSVHLQPLFQSSSVVTGDRTVWGQSNFFLSSKSVRACNLNLNFLDITQQERQKIIILLSAHLVRHLCETLDYGIQLHDTKRVSLMKQPLC